MTKQRRRLEAVSFGLFLLLILWSIVSTELPTRNLESLLSLHTFLGRFFPPDFSDWDRIWDGFLETLRIATLGTLGGVLLSIPLAFLCSRAQPVAALRVATQAFIGLIRTIPSLILALLGVAVLGPTMLAGVLALVFYSTGYLAKFFSDLIDNTNFRSAKVLRIAGAHPIQAFQYTIWHGLRSSLLSQTLWMFEYNIRSASIIGYVGAGGLGTLLHQYTEFYQWDRFAAVLIFIFVIVMALDRLNESLRRLRRVERV
jgi:phosphonate transport system permease protein